MTEPFSRVAAVVPVRSLAGSKSRLAEPLDQEEREALVLGLLTRTLSAALGSRRVDDVIVVSEDAELLERARSRGATPLLQRTGGLNEGLTEARETLPPGVTAMLVLPVDLACVSSDEVDAVIDAADSGAEDVRGEAAKDARAEAAKDARGNLGGQPQPHPPSLAAHAPLVALVADRHGTGTNVLLVAPPDAIPFRFGEGSRKLHEAEARAAGARFVEIGGQLTFDVDTPEDLLLADMSGLGHEAGR